MWLRLWRNTNQFKTLMTTLTMWASGPCSFIWYLHPFASSFQLSITYSSFTLKKLAFCSQSLITRELWSCFSVARSLLFSIALLAMKSFVKFYFKCWFIFIVLRYAFTTVVGVSCLAVFTASMLPVFSTPSLKWLRTAFFFILGIAVAAPLFYVVNFGDPRVIMEAKYSQYTLGCVIYALGGCLYMTRIPERCKPGTFDMCGHSH